MLCGGNSNSSKDGNELVCILNVLQYYFFWDLEMYWRVGGGVGVITVCSIAVVEGGE